MTKPTPTEMYEQTMKMLKPALERVASDPAFRSRLEVDPLAALAEVNVELDVETRREMEGKRFSEFWAGRLSSDPGGTRPSRMPTPCRVNVAAANSSPAVVKRDRYSSRRRSRPPVRTSMLRSCVFAIDGVASSGTIISTTTTRPSGLIAARQFCRIRMTRASSQSWRTNFST